MGRECSHWYQNFDPDGWGRIDFPKCRAASGSAGTSCRQELHTHQPARARGEAEALARGGTAGILASQSLHSHLGLPFLQGGLRAAAEFSSSANTTCSWLVTGACYTGRLTSQELI